MLGTKRLLVRSKKTTEDVCKSKLFAPNFFTFFGAIVVFELHLRNVLEPLSKVIDRTNREMRNESF